MAVTGRYSSSNESLVAATSFAVSPSMTAHASYSVTGELLQSLGLESRFAGLGRAHTIDLSYAPGSDRASMKLMLKQNRAKLSAMLNFAKVREERRLAAPAAKYEIDARLNKKDTLKLAFNVKSGAKKVKLSHTLDDLNRLDLEYNIMRGGDKFVVLALKHAFSKCNTLTVKSNYGAQKYSLEWDYKTKSGPWTVSTDFSFDKAPTVGDWNVKRRFEF